MKNLAINVPQNRQEVNNFIGVNNQGFYPVDYYNNNISNIENDNRRYWEAEGNRQAIFNNEFNKFVWIQNDQDGLLKWINTPCIRLWRHKDKLYYRATNGELIVGDNTKIEQELSSRYNINLHIVKDLNEVLQNRNEIRIKSTSLAINSLPIVEQEVFNSNEICDIFLNKHNMWIRNLFAGTRFFIRRDQVNRPKSYVRAVLQNITIKQNNQEYLFSWLSNMYHQDKILLLTGNQKVSEDLLVNKVLKQLFNNNLCVTVTDDLLKTKSLEEIIQGTLFFHINNIPSDEDLIEKLKELLTTILIQRTIQTDGYTSPIQGKVIVTMDEPHSFFANYKDICNVFLIDKMDHILEKLQLNSQIQLYKSIENTLDSLSSEISQESGAIPNQNGYANDNEQYMQLIINKNGEVSNGNTELVLDPFNDSVDSLIPDIERQKHTYITGQTGSGKSVLMLTLMYKDIVRNDCSIILLDPHGDLAESTVKLVQDKTRLVYINPFMSEDKIPTINLFHLSDKSESNIAKVTQIILSVLKSVNSDESFSGAMEEVLGSCIPVLLRKDGGSFEELHRFMNDKRNHDLVRYGKNSPNTLESEFFNDDFETIKPTKDAVRRRLKKLLNDPVFSSLMNGTNTIDLERIMNTKGKIIIFNIPKGKMFNTYKYYIQFILGLIQLYATKRADQVESDRVHTHLYIDEFHNFITATSTVSEILAESRKYKLFLTFAHQTITQIKEPDLRDIITSSTNVKIIAKNTNKTLDEMNKTLNLKLDNVENLATGEFYLKAGNNALLKITNTNKLLDGEKNISPDHWEEHMQYQLENYYRRIQSNLTEEELNQKQKEFVEAIVSMDINYFTKVKEVNLALYEELIYNFKNETGYIAQPELSNYFSIIHDYPITDNRNFISTLKKHSSLFKENPKENKKYNNNFRYKIEMKK